ncbi:MAG: hypothetical protein ACKOE0_04455, partial [Actinomycetes bacterium]
MPKPKDLHEYVSFSDPNSDQTWMIDATYLKSNWTCIYGSGCKGVLERRRPLFRTLDIAKDQT